MKLSRSSDFARVQSFSLFVLALLVFLPAASFAQGLGQGFPPAQSQIDPGDPSNDAGDPGDAPEHGVARLSLSQGDVSIIRGDAPIDSQVNAPLVATDRLTTGRNARAEVQLDASTLVRVAPGSEIRMGELEYKRYLVQLAQGVVTVRVLQETTAQIEISTPSAILHILRAGTYRVTVGSDGVSEMTVRSGEADVLAPNGTEHIASGQSMLARGSADDPEFMSNNAPGLDDWDRWNQDRDRLFERSLDNTRYMSPDVYGAEDLNANGRWVSDPQYGNVWAPNVDANWAPYRDGRWQWLDYYGWTWVGAEPWGWAPYHYGNWYRASFGWAWYPGALTGRHYWRPAMVSFFGWGNPGFGVSIGFGNVGWIPLAPRERYIPWYGRGYNRNNFAVNINLNNFRNARYDGAIHGMRADQFGRGGRQSFNRPTRDELSHAGFVDGRSIGNRNDNRDFGRDSRRVTVRSNDNFARFPQSRTPRGDGNFGGNGNRGTAPVQVRPSIVDGSNAGGRNIGRTDPARGEDRRFRNDNSGPGTRNDRGNATAVAPGSIQNDNNRSGTWSRPGRVDRRTDQGGDSNIRTNGRANDRVNNFGNRSGDTIRVNPDVVNRVRPNDGTANDGASRFGQPRFQQRPEQQPQQNRQFEQRRFEQQQRTYRTPAATHRTPTRTTTHSTAPR